MGYCVFRRFSGYREGDGGGFFGGVEDHAGEGSFDAFDGAQFVDDELADSVDGVGFEFDEQVPVAGDDVDFLDFGDFGGVAGDVAL